MRAGHALQAVLDAPDVRTVLDVGSGDGAHADAFRANGRTVTTVNLSPPADYVGSFPAVGPTEVFDAVWVSHAFEHQRDPGAFLDACLARLRGDGLLAITVPPEKPELVGGHLTTWTPGRLLYHLVLAGLDCSEATTLAYGYNISVVVRKRLVTLPPLAMDAGDLEVLAPYFPTPVWQGIDGRLVGVSRVRA